MTCPRCADPIRPGQLTVAREAEVLVRGQRVAAVVVLHVACPTARQIAHARRMGRR
jgi:hypothetical protein